MSLTWVTAKGSNLNVRMLYRHILRRAKRFPSIKRAAIVEDIRATFRQHQFERDPAEIQLCIDNAVNGLLYLHQYTSFDDGNPNWTLGLIGNPIQDPSVPQLTLTQLIASGRGRELAQIAPPELQQIEAPTPVGQLPPQGECGDDALSPPQGAGEEEGPGGRPGRRGGPEVSFRDLVGGGAGGGLVGGDGLVGGGEVGVGDDLANAAASVAAAMQRKKQRRRQRKPRKPSAGDGGGDEAQGRRRE